MVCLGQLTLASFRFLLHLDAVRSMIALDLVKLGAMGLFKLTQNPLTFLLHFLRPKLSARGSNFQRRSPILIQCFGAGSRLSLDPFNFLRMASAGLFIAGLVQPAGCDDVICN